MVELGIADVPAAAGFPKAAGLKRAANGLLPGAAPMAAGFANMAMGLNGGCCGFGCVTRLLS